MGNNCFQKERSRLAALVACLLFGFSLAGQDPNRVVLVSPDYLLFTWNNDTLSTADLSAFFEASGRDSMTAVLYEANIEYFLRKDLNGVGAVDETLSKSLGLSLKGFADFSATRPRTWKIEIEK